MTAAKKDSKDLTGKIAALAALLVAVGALIDATVALVNKTPALTCSLGLSLPWCPDHPVPIGTSGWMYVGTRIGTEWRTTYAEGIEPALTLYTAGLPIRGMTYRVIRSVNLRSN